jgi:hypothetical protein
MGHKEVRARWRWARVFMWSCGAVVVYFAHGYFMDNDAGVGSALVSLGGVWFFHRWNRNIESREAIDLYIEDVRENNRSNWRRR